MSFQNHDAVTTTQRIEHETNYLWCLAATDDCCRRIKIFSANGSTSRGCRVVPLRLKACRRDRVRITIRIR